MSKNRRNLSLDPDVEAILDDIGAGQSSASAYIEDLVRDAERDWRTAHQQLNDRGWRPVELLAACEVLNGWGLLSDYGRPASWLAIELADGQRLNDICRKWDVSPERWQAHIQRLADDELEARALACVAREFWRHNTRLERVLRREDGQLESPGMMDS